MYKFFIISYKGANSESVKEIAKSLGAWFTYFENQYIVCSTLPFNDVKLKLSSITNQGTDRLLILEVDIKTFEGFLPQNAWDWLNKQKDKIKKVK